MEVTHGASGESHGKRIRPAVAEPEANRTNRSTSMPLRSGGGPAYLQDDPINQLRGTSGGSVTNINKNGPDFQIGRPSPPGTGTSGQKAAAISEAAHYGTSGSRAANSCTTPFSPGGGDRHPIPTDTSGMAWLTGCRGASGICGTAGAGAMGLGPGLGGGGAICGTHSAQYGTGMMGDGLGVGAPPPPPRGFDNTNYNQPGMTPGP